MSYVAKHGRNWGKIIGMGILLTIAGWTVKPWLARQAAFSDMSSSAGAERALLEDSGAGPVMAVLKARFPADFARLRDHVQREAAQRNGEALQQAVGAVLGEVMARDGRHIGQAPHPALATMEAAHLAIIERLRLNPKICLSFVDGRIGAAGALTPETQQLVREFARTQLEAMAAGRDSPAGRSAGAPDQALLAEFDERLRASGMSYNAYQVLTGERQRNKATPTERCDAELHFLRTVQQSPAAQGDRIYAMAMAPRA